MKDLDDPDFGKDNKIFTREKAMAARERLRELLSQMEEEEKEKPQEHQGSGENRPDRAE